MSEVLKTHRIHGRVRLVIENGELVCTGQLPPFDRWPDVLVWGSRLFVRPQHDETAVLDPEAPEEYVEAWAAGLVQYEVPMPLKLAAQPEEVQKLRERWLDEFGGKTPREMLETMAKELSALAPICPMCNGKGASFPDGTRCPQCNGTGHG